MGSSKTTNMINEINDKSFGSRPLLVIVPLKTEIQRFIDSCPNERFCEPEAYYDYEEHKMVNKKENILSLLCNGRSIVTTHSLFNLFTLEIEAEIERQGYIIIIDEEIITIEPLQITTDERKLLFDDSKYASIDPITKRVYWCGPMHEDFKVNEDIRQYRDIILSNRVISFGEDNRFLFVLETPISFFSLSDTYIILTYMFESSDLCSFFKMYNIDYTIEYQDELEEYKMKEKFKNLISFIDPPKSIRDLALRRNTNFSSTHWDSSNVNTKFMVTLRDTLGKYLKRNNITTDELLYACKKNLSSQKFNKTKGRHLTPKGYHGCWIPYNCKATNDYSGKTYIIYMHNVYRNVTVSKYLKSKIGYGALTERTKLENEQYSLSVMLQCLWRTAIRDGKPIKVMIFSNRMKTLLCQWLEIFND
jgi:hypothetical protein